MDKNLYEKCVIYIQVHSGEDVKFYQKYEYLIFRKKYWKYKYSNDNNTTIDIAMMDFLLDWSDILRGGRESCVTSANEIHCF